MSTIQELNFAVDLLQALLWKHNRATKLEGIVTTKQAWYDDNQAAFWSDWLRDVFDLRTANAFGLQVWARILGVRLSIPLSGNIDKPVFGFGASNQNFGNGNFGRIGDGTASLTLDEQRIMLRLRYYKLISRVTIPDVNRALADVFGDAGTVYMLDPMDMSAITYVFDYPPGSRLLGLLQEFDALPRPSGVGVRYVVASRAVFGFGPTNRNFNNGTFATTT